MSDDDDKIDIIATLLKGITEKSFDWHIPNIDIINEYYSDDQEVQEVLTQYKIARALSEISLTNQDIIYGEEQMKRCGVYYNRLDLKHGAIYQSALLPYLDGLLSIPNVKKAYASYVHELKRLALWKIPSTPFEYLYIPEELENDPDILLAYSDRLYIFNSSLTWMNSQVKSLQDRMKNFLQPVEEERRANLLSLFATSTSMTQISSRIIPIRMINDREVCDAYEAYLKRFSEESRRRSVEEEIRQNSKINSGEISLYADDFCIKIPFVDWILRFFR